MDIMEHLQLLLQRDFKFDEPALLMYARMYQIHVGIIMDNKYWSTQNEQSKTILKTVT